MAAGFLEGGLHRPDEVAVFGFAGVVYSDGWVIEDSSSKGAILSVRQILESCGSLACAGYFAPIQKKFHEHHEISTIRISDGEYGYLSPFNECKLFIIQLVAYNVMQARKGKEIIPLYFVFSRKDKFKDGSVKEFEGNVGLLSKKELVSSREVRTIYRLSMEFPSEEVRHIAHQTFNFVHVTYDQTDERKLTPDQRFASIFTKILPPWEKDPNSWEKSWAQHRQRTENKPLNEREWIPYWSEVIFDMLELPVESSEKKVRA